jgi:hypothetical protein
MTNPAHDIIASLWGNSTFGLLTYWWSANKAQEGRGSITTTQIPNFSILDPRHLGSSKEKKARTFFDSVKSQALNSAHQLAKDAVRIEIDEFILRELLDVGANLKDMAGMLAVVRKKLGLEPSFNGGK